VNTRTVRQSRERIARGIPAPVRALAALLALALAACPGRKETPGAAAPGAGADPGLVVATLGGEPLPYKNFERYLADNAGEESTEGEQQDAIKSRLLDQFLEEQLLLRAAGRFKITVSEAEVDSYLKEIGVTEGETEVSGSEGKEAFREKVRQGLIAQKVKDEAVLSKVQVTPGEVEDALKKRPDVARAARQVVLRQIMVDDKGLAEKLRSALSSDPSRFEAVARENSIAPDRGQARMYSEEDLPVELREPLFALQSGQVSPVLEHAQSYLIFQLVRKIEEKDVDLDEVRRRIRMELFQSKGEQALDRFIADLRKETEIRVNRSILPFNYVGEYRN
jgi:parvulin-like peptidyl-prolyl isomerase